MTCPACEARKAARRRGGEYQLGSKDVQACASCVKSHDAYIAALVGHKAAKQIKGLK